MKIGRSVRQAIPPERPEAALRARMMIVITTSLVILLLLLLSLDILIIVVYHYYYYIMIMIMIIIMIIIMISSPRTPPGPWRKALAATVFPMPVDSNNISYLGLLAYLEVIDWQMLVC